MNWLILILVLIAGAATSIQAGVNGELGKKVGVTEGAFVSFLVGTIFLSLLMLFMRKGNISEVWGLPKWQLAGGLLGAIYILIMVIAVPRVGIAAALITLIVGQLTCSTIIDHFGFITGRAIPIDWKKITALMLMAVAVFIYYKK
ncbi:MAG: DMT family transporter [Cytophagaceae bacterium]|nr:DMT family transporter [Cytophagaceae bacterium]